MTPHPWQQWRQAVPQWWLRTISTYFWSHNSHYQIFDWCLLYCGVPPCIPYLDRMNEYKQHQADNDVHDCRGYSSDYVRKHPEEFQPHARECIACGKIHVTSEDCGREPAERKTGNESDKWPRRDDGYKLERARNMGCFDDVDDD